MIKKKFKLQKNFSSFHARKNSRFNAQDKGYFKTARPVGINL